MRSPGGATQSRKQQSNEHLKDPIRWAAVDSKHWFLLIANPPQSLYVLAAHCTSIVSYTHFGRACATKPASCRKK